MERPEPTRRTLLGAATLAAVLGGTSGCSPLSRLPLLGGDDGVEAMLRRIGRSPLEGDGQHTVLRFIWGRAAEAAEALGLDASADLDRMGPEQRLATLKLTDPTMLGSSQMDPDWGPALEEFRTTERLLSPSAAIRVSRRIPEVVLWTDAPLYEDLATALEGYFRRDGDQLIATYEHPGGAVPRWFTELIAKLGEDLVFTTDDSTRGIDAGDSVAELFADPGELIAAIELDDAHVISGGVRDGDEEEPRIEWFSATRFEDPDRHTTRGAARVDGGAQAIAQRMLDVAEGAIYMRVVEAEAEGDLLRFTMSNDPPADDFGWRDVQDFHASSPLGLLSRPLT